MLQKLSPAIFLGCLIEQLEERTGVKCYDNPENKLSPLYSVEIVPPVESSNTKTMFIDVYRMNIHCIAEPVEPHSNAPVLSMVAKLQEALTDDIVLPDPFYMYMQTEEGLQTLKKDESNEGHAVLSYSFRICYGLRCK